MDDKSAVGEGLATLANSSSDILKGVLGFFSIFADNPYPALTLAILAVFAFAIKVMGKPNSSMAEVAKESTSTTEKVTLKQSDLLSNAICKLTDLSADVIDISRSHSKIQEDNAVILSKILETQKEQGALICNIKCLKDNDCQK